MKPTIDINTDEILKKFDSLNLKNQKKAAKQAIRISLNVLVKQAKKNLQKIIKSRITKPTQKGRFKGLKLSQGIKLNVWKDGKTGKVNIMKDGRLKWFETGTQKRRTTYTSKRKAHSTGQIQPTHFFTDAKKTTEKEIFSNLDQSLMQAIKKTWDKAQLM